MLGLFLCIILIGLAYYIFDYTQNLEDRLRSLILSEYYTELDTRLGKESSFNKRLHEALRNGDIAALNNEIQEISRWLQPESLYILDKRGAIITDGTDDNSRQGQRITANGVDLGEEETNANIKQAGAVYFPIGEAIDSNGFVYIEHPKKTDTLIASITDETAAFRNRLGYVFIAIAICGLLVIAVICAVIEKRLSASISRPLREMARSARQFGKGNLTYRIPEEKGMHDGFLQLAHSLNTMASSLKKARDDLAESEQQKTDLLNNTSSVICIKDCEGHYIFVNRMFEKLFHVTNEAVKGKTVYDIFPENVADILNENERKVLETDSLHETEEVIPQDDSLHTYISVRFPLHKKTGEIYAVCSISTDITERKQIQEKVFYLNDKLVTHEARFKAIINQSTEGITVADTEGNYTFVNKAFCDMLGYSENELLKMTVFDVKAPNQDPSSFQRSKTSREGMAVRVLLQRKDGSVFYSEVIGKNIEINGEQQVLGTVRDISEQVRAEEKLIKSERDLAAAQKISRVGSWEMDLKSNKLSWSDETYRIFELDPEKQDAGYQTFIDIVHPDDRDFVNRAYRDSVNHKTPYDIEHRLLMKDGRIKYVHERCETFYDNKGNAIRSLGTVLDITDRKLSEQALRRAQKMDAIGQMAGGIAHDFNNILGIILGNLHMLEKQLEPDRKTQKRIDDIKYSARRAAGLTKRLLGFSRREPANAKASNINLIISGMSGLITLSVTPQVEVEHIFAEGLWKTRIDPGDFEDALLNLVLNARDAMDGRGKLTIETRNVVLDEAYCMLNPDAKPGDYVQLSVSDSGQGISKEQQDHIFEPFYTTKEKGRGTGLGLAMVFAFVKRSGGLIKLYSEQGIGTTFHLYLPRDIESPVAEEKADMEGVSLHGTELLLIVDDEANLVDIAKESLEAQGYRTLTAHNGEQALRHLAENTDIDLLFSDVVMPGSINGFELAEQARDMYPYIKILLTSGYSGKVVADDGEFKDKLLSKPYTLAELSQRIRSLLDGESSGDSG